MEPTPIQIIKPNSNNAISLDEDALRRILSRDEIRSKYVSVISITGAFRQGKSFLLNFLLRFLRHKYIKMGDVSDWLRPEDGPLNGFEWSPGSKRHTTGIMMWPEIFLAKLPSGEEVAIILLDTQGAFDNQSSIADNAKIFALSTLISSVQIFNVMRGIKQYDLTHLQCFGGYGSLLTNSGTAPFQNLCFLVRDWPCPYEHPYGDAGGLAFLEEVMDSQEKEIADQITNIQELFSKITCFLMPYPGRVVDTSKNFTGDLDEIDETFKDHVQDFATMLLSPENLILKSVDGIKVTAEGLMFYIQEYCKVLKDDELPKVETIFKATVLAHHKSASTQAFKLYKKNMDADVKHHPRFMDSVHLYNRHTANKIKAVDYYTKLKKFEDEAVFDQYLVDLKDNMDVEFKRYRIINEEKQRKHEESNRRIQELSNRSQNQASGSGLETLNIGEKVGIAAGVIGAVAVGAFGLAKVFSSSRGNNE